jgi:hypothetical protein
MLLKRNMLLVLMCLCILYITDVVPVNRPNTQTHLLDDEALLAPSILCFLATSGGVHAQTQVRQRHNAHRKTQNDRGTTVQQLLVPATLRGCNYGNTKRTQHSTITKNTHHTAFIHVEVCPLTRGWLTRIPNHSVVLQKSCVDYFSTCLCTIELWFTIDLAEGIIYKMVAPTGTYQQHALYCTSTGNR